MQNKITQDELAQLFSILQPMCDLGGTTPLSAESYTSHIQAIAVLLNALSSKHRLKCTTPLFVTADLILEKETILQVTTSLPHFLDYYIDELLGRSFKHLISAASRRTISTIERHIGDEAPYYSLLYLTNNNSKVVPTFCRFKHRCITIIYLRHEIASTSVQKLYADILVEVAGSFSRNVQLLQDVYNYIVAHPEEPMPNNIQIARMFYSNRQKLKELFRHLLGTSIYQLYNTTRLEKAHQLISNTNLPLLDIASICGFNNYQHFSSLFKKHFGYRPGKLVRPITKARE